MTRISTNTSIVKLIFCFIILVAISLTSACQPSNSMPKLSMPKLVQTNLEKKPHEKIITVIDAPPQAVLPTQLHKINHNGIQFHLVTFDTRHHHLIIADQPNGPGSKWTDATAAAKSNNGLAAINASFFTPEGKPLGIVISNGTKLGSYNQSSLGSGLFHHTQNGATISRKSAWAILSKKPPTYLLQSGPILVEKSKTIIGLSSKNSRPRSFIATDGKNHWCIGHADSCSLSQLSTALVSLKVSKFKISTALNLDGGRSSDLWVSASVNGGSKKIRPFWNKPVRNFLILKSN